MYAVAIARGHVFNDGNKRTALVCGLTFLARDQIAISRSAHLEAVMVDVAQGLVDARELARILQSFERPFTADPV